MLTPQQLNQCLSEAEATPLEAEQHQDLEFLKRQQADANAQLLKEKSFLEQLQAKLLNKKEVLNEEKEKSAKVLRQNQALKK